MVAVIDYSIGREMLIINLEPKGLIFVFLTILTCLIYILIGIQKD